MGDGGGAMTDPEILGSDEDTMWCHACEKKRSHTVRIVRCTCEIVVWTITNNSRHLISIGFYVVPR